MKHRQKVMTYARFLDAAHQGNVETVKDFLLQGAHINMRRRDGRTALHGAVKSQSVELVKLFIHKGANVNAITKRRESPLFDAVRTRNMEIIQILLDAGADVHIKNIRGHTCIFRIVHCGSGVCKDINLCSCRHLVRMAHSIGTDVDILQLLLNHGASLSTGQTSLLYMAVSVGDLEMVSVLVELGANVNFEGENNWTALHYACAYGGCKIIKVLLKAGANINAINTNGNTPLHMVIRCYTGVSIQLVELLLNKGADPHFKNHEGKTALDVADIYCVRLHPNIIDILKRVMNPVHA